MCVFFREIVPISNVCKTKNKKQTKMWIKYLNLQIKNHKTITEKRQGFYFLSKNYQDFSSILFCFSIMKSQSIDESYESRIKQTIILLSLHPPAYSSKKSIFYGSKAMKNTRKKSKTKNRNEYDLHWMNVKKWQKHLENKTRGILYKMKQHIVIIIIIIIIFICQIMMMMNRKKSKSK